MTDRTEMQIPDDVMKAVEAVCAIELVPGGEVRTRRAIARAILAERRRERVRCATIAEQHGAYGVHNDIFNSEPASVDK